MSDHLAYQTVRQHVAELALSSPGAAGTVVPACPEWTVRDLVAHLTENCAGMLGERDAAAGLGLAESLDRWQVFARQVERLAAEGALDISRLLMDAFTHELDLRAALDAPVPADHPAYPPAFTVVVGGLSASIGMRGLPALRLVCESASWVAGRGQPVAVVTAPRYHLYRSLTGRRTATEIAQLDWSEDPSRWLPAFYWGPFRPPTQ